MTTAGAPARPVVGFTMGDPNGIGPEVVLRALLSPVVWDVSLPLLVGSHDVYEFYRRRYRLNLTLFRAAAVPVEWEKGVVPVVDPGTPGPFRLKPGSAVRSAGRAAAESLVRAVGLWNEHHLDAVVTAPVTKTGLRDAGFSVPGQTELLAGLIREKNVMMMMIAGDLRVGLATIHLPLKKVPGAITARRLTATIRVFAESLIADFGVSRPRIAVLGLNPHGGEGGLIGTEEQKILIPLIRKMNGRTIRLAGPFSADGFFGSGRHRDFDGVLAMYHDQGLIPVKMSSFGGTVNYSAGLRIVRTSPGHGTAYEIAGRGVADAGSMIEAVRVASAIVRTRAASERRRR